MDCDANSIHNKYIFYLLKIPCTCSCGSQCMYLQIVILNIFVNIFSALNNIHK